MTTRVFFPGDFASSRSFQELLRSDEDCIFHCLAPHSASIQSIKDIGAPRSWINQDLIDRRRGFVYSNGWAVLKVSNVWCWRGIFLINRDGDIVLPFPKWRVGWFIDYYGVCRDTIQQRFENHFVVSELLKSINSSSDVDLGVEYFEEGTVTYGSTHGHWLFEEFIPLSIWNYLGHSPTLVASDLKGYQRELLNLADIPIVPTGPHTVAQYFTKLLVLVPYQKRDDYFINTHYGLTDGVEFCYNQEMMNWQAPGKVALDFTRNIGFQASIKYPIKRRIFVRRDRGSVHSVCLNEDEVCTLAESYGFFVVDPSKLSGEHEAALFYNAEIVMGILGGGLENIVFCKPGTRVISICGEDSWRTSISRLAAFGKLYLTRIRSPQLTAMDGWWHGAFSCFIADLDVISSALRALSHDL